MAFHFFIICDNPYKRISVSLTTIKKLTNCPVPWYNTANGIAGRLSGRRRN